MEISSSIFCQSRIKMKSQIKRERSIAVLDKTKLAERHSFCELHAYFHAINLHRQAIFSYLNILFFVFRQSVNNTLHVAKLAVEHYWLFVNKNILSNDMFRHNLFSPIIWPKTPFFQNFSLCFIDRSEEHT